MSKIFINSFASSLEEAQDLKDIWKKSPFQSRSEFIKSAINSYVLLNNYSEEPIFKKMKVI